MIKFIKWLLLIVYIILALVWASTNGINGNILWEYDGNRKYKNIITDITDSFLLESGEMIICLKGHLSDSKKHRSNLVSFSI